MPCYYDTPDESDQEEIESRCKIRMYFEATGCLSTLQQEMEAQQKDIKLVPGHEDEQINANLCKVCSILTKEQMESISAFYYKIKWPHETLYDWYTKHLEDDKQHNASE